MAVLVGTDAGSSLTLRRGCAGRRLGSEMSIPDPAPEHARNLELPVEDLLRRAVVHPPYGEQVIDDLTLEEGEALLDAVSS